ncbi:DUF2288 domain-containing protein [Lacisediminimonas sp.]|uniref:DUF2288 domain-containing protein n=1 Tax=Lacisediminimonas sp. TaxID=3060582 RepID=UPI002727818E|nr:DUF2288 domain-containing protein [Lacisediminimonas sp.]MDO8298583.1 DUF2288 domain-containing protein [Lacisediminimonas sp.]
MTSTNDALLHAKLNQETASIAWSELTRWFASGMVVAVSPDLDLIEVAAAMTRDDAAAVSQWMSAQRIAKVTDEQAQAWLDQNRQVWAIVVKPWILVQLK